MLRLLAATAIIVATASACSAGPADGSVPVAHVAAASPPSQLTVAGTPVPTPPTLKVTDPNGAPIAGTIVVFSVASGGGSVSGDHVATDAAGVARVGSWTVGANAGLNMLVARVQSATANTAVFYATGTVK